MYSHNQHWRLVRYKGDRDQATDPVRATVLVRARGQLQDLLLLEDTSTGSDRLRRRHKSKSGDLGEVVGVMGFH